ncbi:MAG: YchJ family protein [Acidobacteriota bacterium]
MTEDCPCCSGAAFEACCGPLLAGVRRAATAEALMRSRYSAYVRNEAVYLGETLLPRKRKGYDPEATLAWNADVTWLGLDIRATQGGGPDDDEGVVEFTASYSKAGEPAEIRETSWFRKKGGTWFYVDGRLHGEPVAAPAVAPQAGRNDPCPCGSGKKFKRCCG